MLAKKIAIAAITGTALLAASGAYAHGDYRYGYRPYYHSDYYRPYRPAPRVVIRTAPRYYYAPPAPVYKRRRRRVLALRPDQGGRFPYPRGDLLPVPGGIPGAAPAAG